MLLRTLLMDLWFLKVERAVTLLNQTAAIGFRKKGGGTASVPKQDNIFRLEKAFASHLSFPF